MLRKLAGSLNRSMRQNYILHFIKVSSANLKIIIQCVLPILTHFLMLTSSNKKS